MSSQLAEHTEKDKEQQVETLKGVKGEERINSVKQLSRLTSFKHKQPFPKVFGDQQFMAAQQQRYRH